MKGYTLGINTGFAVNRYAEPEAWTNIVREAGAKSVQLTADILNVSLPDDIVGKQRRRIDNACRNNGIKITSTFTGAFTRVNHLAHPDEDVRSYWRDWFKRFADLTVDLGCDTIGSHFGILTLKDNADPKVREQRLQQNIDGWHEVAEYASNIGIKQVLWEPMSIEREFGETIHRCRHLQDRVNQNSPLPFKICLDVDHGDLSSTNPDDTNPYKWLQAFSKEAPIIHLKQSSKNKSGHWPFTDEFNKDGRINAKEFMDFYNTLNVEKCEFVLECSFREREPADSSVLDALKSSVNYWRPYIPA